MLRRAILIAAAGISLVWATVLPSHAVAQRQGPADPSEFTLRVDVPVVSLDVSVTDADGRPVVGLDRDDFEILEDGKPRPIQYFSASTAPYHAYLLVDASGSTENKWPLMQQAVEAFVGALEPEDQVSIGLFGHVHTRMSEWNDPRSKTLGALEPAMTLGPIAGTSEVYAAIRDVLDDRFDGIRERKALIVLTDGRDTSFYQEVIRRNEVPGIEDDERFQSLADDVSRIGVPIYIVAVNTDRNRETNILGGDEYRNLEILYPGSGLPDAYLQGVRERMEEVAKVSGGRVLYPASLEDLRVPFREIAETLSRAYSLGYVPEDETSETGRREIGVRVRGAGWIVRQSRTAY